MRAALLDLAACAGALAGAACGLCFAGAPPKALAGMTCPLAAPYDAGVHP